MTNLGRSNPYVTPLSTIDGSKQLLDANGFATLANGTYVFPLVSQSAEAISAVMRTDAAIAFTAIVECNNAPKDIGPGERIADWSNVAGDGWCKDDSLVNAVTSPTGAPWTITNLSFTYVAGAASSAMVQLFGRAAARYRLKVTVTTPGKLAVLAHGKS